MEPGNDQGLGSSGGAVAATLIVATAVVILVGFDGGPNKPLIRPHVATQAAPAVAMTQAVHGPAQSQG